MPQRVVVLGGGSEIGHAVLRILATRGLRQVLLVGRDRQTMRPVADELRSLGVTQIELVELDLTRTEQLEPIADLAVNELGAIDLVLVVAGVLGARDLAELDAPAVATSVTNNFTGPAGAMIAFARVLRAQGSGRIVVLSSVAGYRVRGANFVYGGAKAGLDGFSQGLADALVGSGVALTIVRPGFVRTKMTAGRKDAPLAIGPEEVARAVVRALRDDRAVVWVPRPLQLVFSVIRLLPRSVFRRLPG